MTYPEFQKFIGNLVDYYSRGVIPRQNAMLIWFEDVKHIPQKDLKAVFRQLTQNNWPANLPAEMKRAWSGSARTDSEEQPVGCPECERGIIYVKRKEDFGYYGKYAFRCGRCKTSTLTGIPEGTAKELIAAGWIYDEPCHFEDDECDGLWRGGDINGDAEEDHA